MRTSDAAAPPGSSFGEPPDTGFGLPSGSAYDVPTDGEDSTRGSQWYDAEAGPLVRPYAVTGGRTQPGPSGVRFDLIALVAADGTADRPGEALLGPEHRALLALCRDEIQSVAELSAEADLPVGVVRVLLGDLLEAGCVRVSRPVPPAQLPDERILREVIDGLQAL
ncbi:DUF742 domain-containing protein [Streptomyces pratensis]|jgi:hypothetical protein|uniref:DUF742 domain-containing protein n=1 Tax=Streptomyces pratensis TaxID=1169025 RepID=UPI003645E461